MEEEKQEQTPVDDGDWEIRQQHEWDLEGNILQTETPWRLSLVDKESNERFAITPVMDTISQSTYVTEEEGDSVRNYNSIWNLLSNGILQDLPSFTDIESDPQVRLKLQSQYTDARSRELQESLKGLLEPDQEPQESTSVDGKKRARSTDEDDIIALHPVLSRHDMFFTKEEWLAVSYNPRYVGETYRRLIGDLTRVFYNTTQNIKERGFLFQQVDRDLTRRRIEQDVPGIL